MEAFFTLAKKLNLQERNVMYFFSFMKDTLRNYFKRTLNVSNELSKEEIFKALYSELSGKNYSFDWLLPFFITFVDEQEKEISKLKSRVAELEKKSKK